MFIMKEWSITDTASEFYSNRFRQGLRLRFDSDVDKDLRESFKRFCRWLRLSYTFPIRVPVYVKSSKRITAMDGETVCGTFFEPSSREVEPYIRIAVGDYKELIAEYGNVDDAKATLLSSLAHELTHYFQWVNNEECDDEERERQAQRCARLILRKYAETTDHP